MNVLMLTSSYPKFPGDVTAPFVEEIARGLRARGHALDVVLPFHPDLRRPPEPGLRFFPYRYAPHPGWNVWGYAASLVADVRVKRRVYALAPLVALALRAEVGRLLRARRYDVVHAHWVVPNAAMALGVVRAHGVPLVVSLHGSDVYLAEKSPLAGAFARRALEAAGAVTACSGDLAGRALGLGARPERLRTVPYGVDLARFSPASDSGDAGELRARLGAPQGALLVFAIGRLVEKKGFAVLVEAAARAGTGLHVAIAGAGDLAGALRQRAAALGAAVTLVGPLAHDLVPRALRAADVVAVPSVVDQAGNVDGLPNTLLEALAAGRPLVASRVAGIPDVVEDGTNGLLVAPGDPEALAAALRRLAGDPAQRERLGREARRRARASLGWDTAARAFEECYAQAAALDAR
jgi:glycosyltransferase involved in cell wall biosynthesis